MDKIITIKLSRTNSYLLPLNEGYMLVDTGYYHEWDLFARQLNRLGIHLSNIKFLYLTHHHDDHTGFIDKVTESNPEIRIITNRICADRLLLGANYSEEGSGWCRKSLKHLVALNQIINTKWTLTYPPFKVRPTDILLDSCDNDLLPLTNANFRSIYTPGHSIDSTSLLDSQHNLFCGDAAASFFLFLGTKYAPPVISNTTQLYASWQKIIDLGVETIYPAHGKPFSIDKIKQNINKISQEQLGRFK